MTYILILFLFYFISPLPLGGVRTTADTNTHRKTSHSRSLNRRIRTSQSKDDGERVQQGKGVYNHKSFCFSLDSFLYSFSGQDGTDRATAQIEGGGTIYIIIRVVFKTPHPSKESSGPLYRTETELEKFQSDSTSLSLVSNPRP